LRVRNRGMAITRVRTRVSVSDAARIGTLNSHKHSVWPALMPKPRLQLSHMVAPCLLQAARVLGEPLGQLHTLADTRTETQTHTHTHKTHVCACGVIGLRGVRAKEGEGVH
jgi:hypothetical protein